MRDFGRSNGNPVSESLTPTVSAVSADLKRIVDTLNRTISIAEGSDRQLAEQLARTKDAAERAFRLSRLVGQPARIWRSRANSRNA